MYWLCLEGKKKCKQWQETSKDQSYASESNSKPSKSHARSRALTAACFQLVARLAHTFILKETGNSCKMY
jgi:hypothetical protein